VGILFEVVQDFLLPGFLELEKALVGRKQRKFHVQQDFHLRILGPVTENLEDVVEVNIHLLDDVLEVRLDFEQWGDVLFRCGLCGALVDFWRAVECARVEFLFGLSLDPVSSDGVEIEVAAFCRAIEMLSVTNKKGAFRLLCFCEDFVDGLSPELADSVVEVFHCRTSKMLS